jgi:hypothetical protein
VARGDIPRTVGIVEPLQGNGSVDVSVDGSVYM